MVGGEKIATFTVEATGGWTQWQSFTVPVQIEQPGLHDVGLRVLRGKAKPKNALVNIKRLIFSAGPPTE